jgi:hypothetical protein
MDCHLVTTGDLTKDEVARELREISSVYEGDHFDVHLRACRRCGQLFLYCFRKHISPDWREEDWAFWVPVAPTEAQEVIGSHQLYRAVGRIVSTRPHLCLDPRGNLSWSKFGNLSVGQAVFPQI